MEIDTLVRITDVQTTREGCTVAYAVEDRETCCVWDGPAPGIGEIYLISLRAPGKNALHISGPTPGCWKSNGDAMRWRKPASPANGLTRMEVLRRRHKVRRAVRDTLDTQGFTEIDVPLLVHGAPPEVSIDSFKVEDRYLITSSEYQLRRLAVGGFTRTYSLTKNFRYGDNSTVRNPEFTMLEWGRIAGTMKEVEQDAEKMVGEALEVLKSSPKIIYQGANLNLKAPWDRLPVREAIERYTGVTMKDFEASSCREAAAAAGLQIKPNWAENRGFLFSLLMDHLQPNFGIERPVFLTEWPLFQTSTAAPLTSDPTLAERSELFIAGIEVADGFADLSEASTQARLFAEALAYRVSEGKDRVELDQMYLSSMNEGYPFGAAMALGFDRLVMLLTDQKEIKNVLAFAWDEV